MKFVLKPGMLLGCASAATQWEGGDENNSWYGWYRRGYVKDGADPSAAVDHYRRWREDAALMGDMGIQCCRLGVEWSRVEPEEGVFDEKALSHYREELAALAERGIRPLVTLHQFSNPLWLEEKGAFASSDNITYFLRFARKVAEGLGDLASEYVTFNEPNVYAYNGYLDGSWPPGKRNLLEMAHVMTNLTAAHIEAYGLIRRTRLQMGFSDTRVGVAMHLRSFRPKDPRNPVHRFWTARAERIFQWSMAQAMCTGRAAFPIGGHPSIVPGRYCDFHGVNYYARTAVGGHADSVCAGSPGVGWEIYPQGIAEVCRKVHELLPRPIYITANGVCDNSGRCRARFIADHLQALCLSALPVERYYHWSFLDGWEWLEGLSARSGLVSLEGSGRQRVVKPSGEFYRQVIAQGGVSQELYSRYCGAPYPGGREEEG